MRSLAAILFISFSLPAQAPKALSALPAAGFKFEGAWDCAGQFRGGKVHKAAFQGSLVLAGKWLQLEERDVEPATGYMATYLIGEDAQNHQLVEFDANNFGAATFTSDTGWQDGTLTMTSPVATNAKAPYALNRFVYTVAGADSFSVDWQISKTTAPDWQPADHLLCRRA